MSVEPDINGELTEDESAVAWQLGRVPRGMVGVAHRCVCGDPAVVETAPRLPDGTPFPTTYYLTCPRATAAASRLENAGVMAEMTAEIRSDEAAAAAHQRAHEDYLRRRAALGEVPEIAGVSAGGMPDRVKCLHVLAAHALAAGPGATEFGDRTLEAMGAWWERNPCHTARSADGA